MKKVFTLLTFFVLAFAGTLQAKDKVTTLWEGTYTGNILIPVANLVQGATITVTLSVTESENSVDRKLRIFYCKNDANWTQTSFSDISDWVELSTTETSYSFTVTEAAMTTLKDNTENTGSRGGLYIGASNSSYLTISKITMAELITPSNSTNISLEEYTADWTGKSYSVIASAKIGDVLKFTYTATGTYFQIEVMNSAKDEQFENKAYSVTINETYTYEYEIPNYATLKKVREEGFSIKGASFTISSVDLLTYNDSYGYETIRFGATGLATWSSDKKYDFARAGITACYASEVSNNVVRLSPMNISWNNEGYILRGTANETYDVLESKTTDGTYRPSTNYLKPNIDESEITASTEGTYHYIFAWDKTNLSSVGFYNLTENHILAANKAYLETTENYTPQQAPMLRLDFGEENNTTSVEAIEQTAPCKKWLENGQLYILRDGVTYDIMGRIIK